MSPIVEALFVILVNSHPIQCGPMNNSYESLLTGNYGEEEIHEEVTDVGGITYTLEFWYDHEDTSYTILTYGGGSMCVNAVGFLGGEDV